MATPYSELLRAAEMLDYPFPIAANRLATVVGAPFFYSETALEAHAAGVRPIVQEAVRELAQAFLDFRRAQGSSVERACYQDMDLAAFFAKLIRKRPLAFLTAQDQYLLRDGKTAGSGGFDAIGTVNEAAPLVLTEYNSYPEMQLAALIGASVPTHFINNGSRNNHGIPAMPGSFEESGIYTGLVGARFERAGQMEWQHLIVSANQNTAQNGYGPQSDPFAWETQALAPWARFYGEGANGRAFFPDYKMAVADDTGSFAAFAPFAWGMADHFLNKNAYTCRMRAVVEPFLLDANDRAKAAGKPAYVIAVGYGIGVWAIPGLKDVQAALIVEAFAEVIAAHSLPYLADLCFSWYPESCTHCGGAADGEWLHSNGNALVIHFEKNNPIEKLRGPDEGKLLVASYAWDGNSYPGNEYWIGSLSASGDPAAACCSMIGELQNPDVNPAYSGANVWVGRPESP